MRFQFQTQLFSKRLCKHVRNPFISFNHAKASVTLVGQRSGICESAIAESIGTRMFSTACLPPSPMSSPSLFHSRFLSSASINKQKESGSITGTNPEEFQSVKYWTEDKGRVAHLMLNRPDRLNAIDFHMPLEIERAVKLANWDDKVKVILIYGAGDSFCSGYDLKLFSEGKRGEMMGNQEMPWCPLIDFRAMNQCTQSFMEIWRSTKPVIAKIKRVAIGGGSDIALACDITFTEDSARIGYPPSRVWGCPTTAFWFYRVGMERAKRILFSGEILSGEKAASIGLIGESLATPEELDETVDEFISRIVTVPSNQLWFQKQMVNQAVESMGLGTTQRLATIFDGMSRHTPEGVAFQQRAAKVGFKVAVMERDSGMEVEWSDKKH